MIPDWKDTIMSVLNEGKGKTKLQIYCDMDGVLVDFEAGIQSAGAELMTRVPGNMEHYSSQEPNRKSHDYMVYKYTKKVADQNGGWDADIDFMDEFANRTNGRAVNDMMYWYISKSRKWWAELNWVDGGQELWSAIAPYNPIILSAPVGPRSIAGKQDWCKSNLGLNSSRVIVTPNKSIQLDGPAVLIDDREKYLNQFKSAGGLTIQHITGAPGPTLAKLKGMMKK